MEENWEDEIDDYLNKISKSSDITNNKNSNLCNNDECIQIFSEINTLEDEISNLDEKILLMENQNLEKLIEVSKNKNEIRKKKSFYQMNLELYENESDLLNSLDYQNLTILENKMLNLLVKVKQRISEVKSKSIRLK